MAEGGKGTATDVYALGTGDSGAARLKLLDEVYGKSTRQMLLDAGLSPGMRVLDLACGTGTISCWMAGVVGATGSVVGVDTNPEQLVVARTHWSQCGGLQPVEFLEASAYETGLPAETFDLVHCRLLLCHLTRPADAIAEMYRLLKPGGVFVCQDLHLSSIFAYPHSQAYARFIELGLKMGKLLNVNYDFALDLPREVLRAGFGLPVVCFDQPVFLRGPGKRLWEQTFAEISPAIARSGVAREDELTLLLQQMHDVAGMEDVFIAQARLPGVWAVK
jgi:SAM-dependent methyltransferase